MSLLDLLNFSTAGKKISIEPAGVSFETGKHQTVLESGLAQGLAMPHSCTVGTCGTCKCKLREGKIREITNFAYVLSAEELRSNVILTCQAMAKTDLILEIEDFEPKKLHPPEDFTGRILAHKDITHDIREVTLELDRPIRFDAGQYIQISVDDIFGARSYSFAMAPEDEGNKTISLFIRKVPEGEFTGALFEGRLQNRDLQIHGPAGNFWLRDGQGPIICIAGGSGLAPVLSILEQALKSDVNRPCVVLLGARTQQDIYGIERMEAIQERWDGAFTFAPVLSHEAENSDWQGLTGFVNTAISEAAGALISNETDVYMCGPPPMIDACTDTLLSLGIDQHRIHFDKFLDASHGVVRHE